MCKKAVLGAAFLVFAVLAFAGSGGAKAEKQGIVYYGSFAGYHHPVKPVEELSREDAASRNAYCIGFFDEAGKLYRFEKYLRAELFFRYDYVYGDDGRLTELRIINSDGKESVHRFDDSGKSLRKN